MLNNRPTFQIGNNGKTKYHQGLYVPKHPEKVIKLNNQGGLYYRSSWEQKLMIYFDMNPKITNYGAEFMSIQYKQPKYDGGIIEYTEHRYFPDFYYELMRSDGSLLRVLAEVKPEKETVPPVLGEKYTHKQLKNFEYTMLAYNRNIHKWEAAAKFCENRGIEFVIITEVFLKQNGLLK